MAAFQNDAIFLSNFVQKHKLITLYEGFLIYFFSFFG